MTSYSFGAFQLDLDRRQLVRDGAPVHLSPKGFQLLTTLVESAPRALSKSDLQEVLWPRTFVVEANLQHLVGEIRSALGDATRPSRYVRTVHGFGYAFQQPVVRTAGPPGRSGRTRVCLLRWEGGRATLPEGEHVIGRDPSADVVLDFGSVSRRHARIRVRSAAVTLEDAGSKNGSFVRNTRVERPVRLQDGDDIVIGLVTVSVRILTQTASTQTAVFAGGRGS